MSIGQELSPKQEQKLAREARIQTLQNKNLSYTKEGLKISQWKDARILEGIEIGWHDNRLRIINQELRSNERIIKRLRIMIHRDQ